MAITIDDIAKEAKVAKMTVSRVINNFKYISPKTKNKVQNVINKYNYNINLAAKHLSEGKRLNLICLLTGIEHFYSSYYFTNFINTIEESLNKINHMVFLTNIGDASEKRMTFERLEMIKNLYHGKIIKGVVILCPVIKDYRIEYLSKNNVEGIIIGGKCTEDNFGYIDVNNIEGTKQAMTYIYEKGHRKIAIVNSPITSLTSAKERQKSYKKYLKSKNIEIKKEYIINDNYSKDVGKSALKALIDLEDPPTAIFAGNDEIAIGIYKQAEIMGMKIPDDISICGFDNFQKSSQIYPPLTTVTQPYQKIGETIADMTVNRKYNDKIIIPVELIERSSVKSLLRNY